MDLRFSISRIADICGLSRSALYKKMQDLGISYINRYDNIDNNRLDNIMCDIKQNHPKCGEVMVIGHLRARGLNIQRKRVRDSIRRVDPGGADQRTSMRIHRRTYYVPCPNFLWHIDGNHKLIRWGLVVHTAIDGFSRFVMFCKCNDNNRAETVLSLFQNAIIQYGRPLKVRTDNGGENVSVWQDMVQFSPAGDMAALTGSPVHNQRVERFNRDLNTHCEHVIKRELYELEAQDILDPSNNTDLFCLHYVYLPRINKLLCEFVNAHNHHSISTEHSLSPRQLFLANQHLLSLHSVFPSCVNLTGTRNIPQNPTIVTVPKISNPLNSQQYQSLCQQINPLSSNLSRVDLFRQVVEYVGNTLL